MHATTKSCHIGDMLWGVITKLRRSITAVIESSFGGGCVLAARR